MNKAEAIRERPPPRADAVAASYEAVSHLPIALPSPRNWQSLPPALQEAAAQILSQDYRELVLQAPSSFQAATGRLLLQFTWVELLEQFRLSQIIVDSFSSSALPQSTLHLFARHLRLVHAKNRVIRQLVKLKAIEKAVGRSSLARTPHSPLPTAYPPSPAPTPDSKFTESGPLLTSALPRTFENHPALLAIRASPALFQRQGALVAGFRHRDGRRLGPYYRLVWRQDGHQRSIYLGPAGPLLDAIRQELRSLRPQAETRCLDRVLRDAGRALRVQRRLFTTQSFAVFPQKLRKPRFVDQRPLSASRLSPLEGLLKLILAGQPLRPEPLPSFTRHPDPIGPITPITPTARITELLICVLTGQPPRPDPLPSFTRHPNLIGPISPISPIGPIAFPRPRSPLPKLGNRPFVAQRPSPPSRPATYDLRLTPVARRSSLPIAAASRRARARSPPAVPIEPQVGDWAQNARCGLTRSRFWRWN